MYLISPFDFLFTLYYILTPHGLSPFSFFLSHFPMLPEAFLQQMSALLGAEEAQRFCKVLTESEPPTSVRLNSRKESAEILKQLSENYECDVPWCTTGKYLKERPSFTLDPALHAGAYYVQEAASMFIEQAYRKISADFTPDRLLDLCAAPGGKSTLWRSLLPDGALLVANEPMRQRAEILAENLTKWGHPDVIVTNAYPNEFSGCCGMFDVIATDVPCSGEGMFRKDEQAVAEWSMDNVMMCVERQRGILRDIWHALKPGGLLVYSTCTFNRFEDEDNARWICDGLGAELLEERHFLPGRDRGEGFYCAAIRKSFLPDMADADERTAQDVAHRHDAIRRKANSTLRLMPQAFLCEGPQIELSYDDALRYLRREAIRVEAPKGPVTLSYMGFPLGPGKGVGNRINNLYPEAWRIRTTYTKRWSLWETER